MFVGHYGVSFAIKSADKQTPLWILFVAVQFVDVLWGVLVLLGVEKVRIVPGITASNPLDLYYMPYTHSLVAAFAWSIAAIIGYRVILPNSLRRIRLALLLGLAVFSHWILDVVVHRPDLPLYDDTHKMGFGLWKYPIPTYVLEGLLLFGGMWLYLRSTSGNTLAGRFGMPAFGAVMLVVHAIAFWGPPPAGPSAAAVTFLALYAVFASIAFWLEKTRHSAIR